jgi:glutathione S-transferase
MIRIYNFPAPTRALRPIWLCEEMGLAYQVELTGFPTGAEYRARYPIGSVPFLEDDDGVGTGRRRFCPARTIRTSRACWP